MSKQLETAIAEFMYYFELVFHQDWEFSRGILSSDIKEAYITEEGTFLEPLVEDEGNNWGNRGCLLASYRDLIKLLDEAKIDFRSHP
jgi:hypothetical protein